MPDAFEFPGMLRAIVPFVRAGNAVVFEVLADCFPSLATVIGALNHLAKPSTGLRCVKPMWFGRRSLHVINLPPGKMRTANVPLLAFAIAGQNESAFFGAY
jgi:hypothetical protein